MKKQVKFIMKLMLIQETILHLSQKNYDRTYMIFDALKSKKIKMNTKLKVSKKTLYNLLQN